MSNSLHVIRSWLFLACFLLIKTSAQAGGVGSGEFANSAKNFDVITGLKINAELTVHFGSDLENALKISGQKTIVDLRLKKDLFYLDFDTTPALEGQQSPSAIIAWDGHSYQNYSKASRRLSLNSERKSSDALVTRFNPLAMWLPFLCDSTVGDQFSLTLWDKIGGVDTWAKLFQRMRNIQYDQKGNILAEVAGFPFSKTQEPTYYKIVFSKINGFFLPMSWQFFTEKGHLILDYKVTDFAQYQPNSGSNFKISYPRKAVSNSYIHAGDRVDTTATFEVGKISVLDTTNENNDFTIDPALAQTIYDEKSKSLIDVPIK